MKNFLDIDDIPAIDSWIGEAIEMKKQQHENSNVGKFKTIGLLFFNASLRTRLSTQKAAQQLGMEVMIMNVTKESWKLEYEDGSIMNVDTVEHVKEAAKVISQYCDIIGIRAFPKLIDKQEDESEIIIRSFAKYATVPVLNMESATAHPLQAITDAMTITELKIKNKPKVVLQWAPHPKALPQAVPNSFVKIMKQMNVEFVITHPQGYALNTNVTNGVTIMHDKSEALKGADFVYVKNWSSYQEYGQVLTQDSSWMLTQEDLKITSQAKVMHCLPVRRNVVIADEVLDSPHSVVEKQAYNRTYAAQMIIKKLLDYEK